MAMEGGLSKRRPLSRLIELVVPERLVADDVDPKQVEGFSNRLIDLADELDDRCCRFG